MSKFSKEIYSESIAKSKVIAGAINALDGVTKLNPDEELSSQINTTRGMLSFELNQQQAIIKAGDALKDSVDPMLINRCMERLRVLGDLLKVNAEFIQNKAARYEKRCQESQKLRVQLESHKPLDTEPTTDDEARIAQERALLELEQHKINEFLKSVPFVDNSLLIGTELEPLLKPGKAA